MKAFSAALLKRERQALKRTDPHRLRIAFCGNIANGMYNRAKPLRHLGYRIAIYLNPQDDFIMSHPGWEEFDGVLPPNEKCFSKVVAEQYIRLPEVADVFQLPQVTDWRAECGGKRPSWLRRKDIILFEPYLSLMKTLIALQDEDVLWCTQYPYLGYLSGRPYVASQSGGDMWLETSRADMLGELTRFAFGQARLLLASNPWSFAHARRLGFRQMIYLPRILDDQDYSPGEGTGRREWEAQSDGRFFVLTTSRLDERNKGSSIGLRGFALFARENPEARLVLIGWGKDNQRLAALLDELEIGDRVIGLPLAGKARLRDHLRSADVFMDQFVLGYFGSAGLEALACGLPVLGRIEGEQYEALCETGRPPIFDCSEPSEVAAVLVELHASLERRKRASEESRCWFLENHGPARWRDDYLAVLAATACCERVDFSRSPLAEPLSTEEQEYHAAGLAAAPAGPEYGW